MEKVMNDLKLAEAKQGSFISLIDEFQAKSSSILSLSLQWKDLDIQYGSIRESLLQHARQLAMQATEVEEAWRSIEAREIEVEVKLEMALGFLDEVGVKEGELGLLKKQFSECDSGLGSKNREFQRREDDLGLLKKQIEDSDSKLGLKNRELQGKERDLGYIKHRVEDCKAELEGKERELGFLQKALDELRREVCEREGQRDSAQKAVEEESKELQTKREELGEIRRLIAKCYTEHEVKEKQLVECGEELEGKQKLLKRVANLLLSSCTEIRAKEEELTELRRSIIEYNAEYELKESQLLVADKALQDKERGMGCLEHRLEECREEFEGKEKLLGAAESKLAGLREEICGKEGELCSLQKSFEEQSKELESRRNEIEKMTKLLSICSSELKAKERELSEARNSIIECNAKHKSKEEELDLVALKLQHKVAEMGSVQQRLEEFTAGLEAKQKLLSSTESTLDELREEVCRKQRDLGSLCNSIEERSKELELRQNEISRVEDLLSGCRFELHEKEKELTAVRNMITECNTGHELKQKQLAIELQEKEKELTAVRHMITECNTGHELKQKQLAIVAEELQVNVLDLDSVQHRVKASTGELEAKQKLFSSLERVLEQLREKVSEKEEEFGSLQKYVEEQSKELDCRQKEVERTMDLLSSCNSELQRKERELGEIRNMVMKWNAEHDLKENQLTMEEGEFQIKERDLDSGLEVQECGGQLQSNQELLGYLETALAEHCKLISFKEKDLSSLLKSIELKEAALSAIESSIKSRDKVLKVKDKLQKLLQSKIDRRSTELESLKEQKISIQALVEDFTLALESNSKSVEMAGEQMNSCCSKLELKLAELYTIMTKLFECRNKLADRRKHVEKHAEAVEMQRTELQKKAELFRLREEQLGSKEKLIDERFTELEAKEKELSSLLEEQRIRKQAGTVENIYGVMSCESNPPDPALEEPSPPDLTDDEVSTALQSSDPAKMIFDQLKQSISQIGAKRYDQTVVRNRVVMLERLMGVPANVSPEVKEASIELAVAWRGKLRLEAHCSMDIIAFFLFLAVFGVGSHFKAEDMLELASVIAHHERAPELCRSLGLAKWIPGLIQSLSKKHMHMEAIRFSLAFKQVRSFPPNLLLSKHLEKTRIFEDGKNLLESQYEALNKHLESLKAMSQRVAGLGLDPSVLNQKISDHLHVLETLLGHTRSCLLATGVVIKSQRYGVATISGNKSPLQLGNLTEGQKIKRQKN